MPNALEFAATRTWLILPEHLENLCTIAERQNDIEALETRLGKPLDNSRTVSVRAGGVAVIPVTGPIFRYANLFTRISGATSTQMLATDIQTALDNPQIKAIILNVDSPGGEANGINELADMVFAARGRKKVVAYIGGMGASAAYWIASAASEVVIDETAIAGSIGAALEIALSDDAEGGKRYQIVSRNAPNKRPDLTTEEGRAKLGEIVDAMGDVFQAKVARHRSVAVDDVPAMGDHGGVRVGAAAVAAGLADRTGSLESVIYELANAAIQPRGYRMTTVSTTEELQAAIAAGVDPSTIQVQAVQGEFVTGTVEGFDIDGIKASAVQDERKRISAIQSMARPGFDAEIKAAIEQGLTPEATALSLLTASQDRGISIEGIKNDATQAQAAAAKTGGAAKKSKFSVSALWAARKGVKA